MEPPRGGTDAAGGARRRRCCDKCKEGGLDLFLEQARLGGVDADAGSRRGARCSAVDPAVGK